MHIENSLTSKLVELGLELETEPESDGRLPLGANVVISV